MDDDMGHNHNIWGHSGSNSDEDDQHTNAIKTMVPDSGPVLISIPSMPTIKAKL